MSWGRRNLGHGRTSPVLSSFGRACKHGHSFGITGSADHKMHQWSLGCPARISVAGRTLEAEEDLIVFGFSVGKGVPLKFERRIAKAWSAFHAQGTRLTSNCHFFGTRWGKWFRHVSRGFGLRKLGVALERCNQKQSGCDRQPHDPRCHGPSQNQRRGLAELAHSTPQGCTSVGHQRARLHAF